MIIKGAVSLSSFKYLTTIATPGPAQVSLSPQLSHPQRAFYKTYRPSSRAPTLSALNARCSHQQCNTDLGTLCPLDTIQSMWHLGSSKSRSGHLGMYQRT